MPLSSSGIHTVSTSFPSSIFNSHLIVPSCDLWVEEIFGLQILKFFDRRDLNSFEIFVISLKSIVPGHIRKNYEKIGFNVSLPKLINFKSKDVLNFINKDSKIYKYVKKDLINKVISENDIQNNSYFLFKFINLKLMIDQN